VSRYQFKLPDIGEGVTEGEVVAWHVEIGDRVDEDQLMVEVMTDKATVTIGAPRAGKIAQRTVELGGTIHVGDVLVVIETGNGSRPSVHPPGVAASAGSAQDSQASASSAPLAASAVTAAASTPAATAVGEIRETLPGTAYFASAAAAQPRAAATAASVGYYAEKPLATPATRKLARDLGLDLRHVRPTGPGGRVTKADLMSSSTGEPQQADLHALPGVEPERVPFVGLRRRIAERMQTAKNTAAHFTFVEECDVARLKDVRQRLIPQAQAQGVELTYLAFIVTATVAALKKHPMLNARLDVEANELVLPREQNIGIAVATDQGLVVPVIHRADRLSILEIAKEIQRLSNAARDNELTVPELQGSTFTIT
jgi:pyruvate dehydrogenase E2 component (dihydrolipoamide acetyltransferase)